MLPKGPTVADVVRAASFGPGRGKRSQLYLWLYERHDEMVVQFARNPRSWAAWAGAFAAMGLRDLTDKKLTGETARSTWWRVRRDVAAARSANVGRTPISTHPVAEPETPADGDRSPNDALARVKAMINARSGR